jgi:hypothetical protein
MARYGKKAQDKVEKAMHERKRGTLKSGKSGKKVTSKKQAIAIGLSEAREEGIKEVVEEIFEEAVFKEVVIEEEIKKPGAKCTRPYTDRRSKLSPDGHVLVNHSRDRLFARRTDYALHFFSVAEKNQRRNTFNAVALCSRRVVVHIQLHHTRILTILLRNCGYRRRQHTARGTPFRPKINQHRFAGA